MKYLKALAAALGLSTAACSATPVLHTGQFTFIDQNYIERDALVWWITTDHTVRRNTGGSIHIVTSCSNDVITFDQQPNGIIFRPRPYDELVYDRPYCGRVVNANHISEIDDVLYFTISCEAKPNPFAVGNRFYPTAQRIPYRVEIQSQIMNDKTLMPTLACK